MSAGTSADVRAAAGASGFVCFADLTALTAFLTSSALARMVGAGLVRAADQAPLALYADLCATDLALLRQQALQHGGSMHSARASGEPADRPIDRSTGRPAEPAP